MMPHFTACLIERLWQTGWRALLLMMGYGLAFLLLHRVAAYWGQETSFSLWYPAAGLRFAMLWQFGPQLGPVLAFTELIGQMITGVVRDSTDWLTMLGVAGSSLGYAIAVALVKARLSQGTSSLTRPPMPVGFAMLISPLFAVCMSLPWGLFGQPGVTGSVTWSGVAGTIATFWIGDALGVLLIAPPLLWALNGGRARLKPVMRGRVLEAGAVAAAGCLVSSMIWLASGTLRLEPLLLCSIWIALRLGRLAAWLASAAAAILVLLWEGGQALGVEQRANLHMLLVATAIASYLVGSYAEAETELRRELKRQQRLLLHAERLKTLRAMSLAVIHDLSQPLSTLAIEVAYLRELCGADPLNRAELSSTSALIEQKAASMAGMIRRMRMFGSDAAGELQEIPAVALLNEVVALVRLEAEAAGVRLVVDASSSAVIMGREVELQQALVNLVRNAMAAAAGGVVTLRAEEAAGMLHLTVQDDAPAPPPARGMGIGLILARAIAEGHGGVLHHTRLSPVGSRYALLVPVAGAKRG